MPPPLSRTTVVGDGIARPHGLGHTDDATEHGHPEQYPPEVTIPTYLPPQFSCYFCSVACR